MFQNSQPVFGGYEDAEIQKQIFIISMFLSASGRHPAVNFACRLDAVVQYCQQHAVHQRYRSQSPVLW